MTTPEDELEAAIWRAMTDACVTCPDPLGFIVDMQLAAKRYAAGDSPAVTALRREVLHRDSGPQGQDSASTRGGDDRAAPELRPPGSGAFPQDVGDGGATLSTEASIPGVFTSRYGRISTDVETVIHRGVDA